MSAASPAARAAEHWTSLLAQDEELSPAFWERHAATLHDRRLTFGGRLSCPFLRPMFLDPAELRRVRNAAETIAAVGERLVAASAERPEVLDALGLTAGERDLVSIDPGYRTASTASRLDAFLLPDALWCAEYNAESPAGLGYTETLSEVFDELAVMRRFKAQWRAEYFRLCGAMLEALLESYREWGGRASPPTMLITDFHGVPTWTEFEILRDRFEASGIPTVIAAPGELEFDGRRLAAGGRPVDLVYRRALMNDLIERPDESRALLDAYRARAVCMANTLRCKLPHKKAFFALLTDPAWSWLLSDAERRLLSNHVPWTRVMAGGRTTVDGRDVDLVAFVREARSDLVIKPNDEYGGSGVALGWEASPDEWDATIHRALAAPAGAWVVQRRIPVRRETYPMVETPHRVVMRDMLVDLAPYVFRGRVAGFLTRLSSTGLANVTSGGGQVPAFVVEPLVEP